MIPDDLSTPILFAHRGASAHAPENTLASFRLALEQKAEAIELDAKLTSDGVVVVIHDSTVNRTTNGKGKVREIPLTVLRTLDAGSFFSPAFSGERIPTLEEVFEELGGKLYINVELTNYTSPGDGLVKKVVNLVKKHNLEYRVLFSSFNPLNLLQARQLLPQTPVGLLTQAGIEGFLGRSWFGRRIAPKMIHPYLSDTTADFIRRQHTLRRRVHVWTVNDPAEMRRLFAAGVDGIFTDDPLLARQVLEAG